MSVYCHFCQDRIDVEPYATFTGKRTDTGEMVTLYFCTLTCWEESGAVDGAEIEIKTCIVCKSDFVGEPFEFTDDGDPLCSELCFDVYDEGTVDLEDEDDYDDEMWEDEDWEDLKIMKRNLE